MTTRRNFSDKFKAKVALEALRGDKTVQEIAAQHHLPRLAVFPWKVIFVIRAEAMSPSERRDMIKQNHVIRHVSQNCTNAR